jgi:hypothetical protein
MTAMSRRTRIGAQCRNCQGPLSYWSKTGLCKKSECFSLAMVEAHAKYPGSYSNEVKTKHMKMKDKR